MKKTVYIETTIPSFYYETRLEPEMVARRNWTRRWWEQYNKEFEMVTCDAVIDELENGEYPFKKETLKLIDNVSILAIEEEIIEIAQVYIRHHLMPDDIAGDALHLAVASYYKCDFLLTWNCKHLANVNKFDPIRRVNMLLDLFTPILITPLEFIEEESYDD